MAALDQLRHIDNLRRAWRWIQSNADASYKSYFRSLYQHYAVAEDALLADLSSRLKRGIYEPDAATKLFFPKASGVLRPYSLLSVEDQIVYQAAVNLIAEKLAPKVRHRQLKTVFGHLYAGKTSTWFYRKWSAGYAAFNDATRKAVDNGLVYTASFDLTACYDSLDHGVLCHFLRGLGLDKGFCDKLTEWLEKWTATSQGIFHHHGIPQGPLSSGLLSEVVLSYFDDLKVRGAEFRYLRYVDDIRLFARNEQVLRRLLVALDHKSKDIGLFPQSSKISIHRVTDIEKELKSVSNPPEPAIKRRLVDQKRLLARIGELTPRYRIEDQTRFKYLLAHADPSAPLTARLWRILDRHPEVYRNVCSYLRRYKKLPRVAAEKAVSIIKANSLYPSVKAEFIAAVDGRLPGAQEADLAVHLKGLWALRTMQADLLVAVGTSLMRTGGLTEGKIKYACKAAPSWWSMAKLMEAVRLDSLSEASSRAIVDSGVRNACHAPALVAAWMGFQMAYVPPGSRRGWNKSAELTLKEVGLVHRSTARVCGIKNSLGKLDQRIPELEWKKLFGANYAQAERQIVEAAAAAKVNITNFVNLLDVFNDLLVDAVCRVDGGLGTYSLGRIGGFIAPTTSRFAIKYPALHSYFNEVHQTRSESMGSHPLVRRTRRPTGKIPYSFLAKARRLLVAATKELSGIEI
jgi:hypothetical protein